MKIQSLVLQHFRNIQNGQVTFHPNVNIFYGDNGNGKTNLLEAIWLFTGMKSFRGAKEGDMVAKGAQFFYLKGEFAKERPFTAELAHGQKKRQIAINAVKKKSRKELLGAFPSVVFSPEDLFFIKEGPAPRRAFLDGAISQIKPNYSQLLAQYKQVLSQKNTLLKSQTVAGLEDLLDVYNAQLANLGTLISFARGNYIKQLTSYAVQFYAGISRGKEQFQLAYIPSVNLQNKAYSKESEALYKRALDSAKPAEKRAKMALAGIHRDDMRFTLNGQPAKGFASQGQQRSMILSLKLAESHLLLQNTGKRPLVLLDDVMSELDEKRQRFLLNFFKDTQVFITCCDKGIFEKLATSAKIFHVENGKFYSQ